MEAAKKLQLHLIGLQRDDLPTRPEMLTKVIHRSHFASYDGYQRTYSLLPMVANGLLWILINFYVQEIEKMEEELKTKTELIAKQERLIQGWREELKDQLDKHIMELERV